MPASAAGQHHHGTHESPALPAHAGLALEAGSVEILDSKPGYRGIAIMGGARWRRFELSLHIPYYRIEVGPVWISGFGDPHLEGRYLAFTRRDLQLGALLVMTHPTFLLVDDDDRLRERLPHCSARRRKLSAPRTAR